MRAAPTTPPTTPPAIAPVLVLLLDEEDDGESLVMAEAVAADVRVGETEAVLANPLASSSSYQKR